MGGLVVAAVLGWRRAAGAVGRWVGVAGAVALALALVGGLAASGVVAGDHAARRFLRQIPARSDTATLSWNGGAGPAIDRAARRALAAMGAHGARRGLVLVPSTFGRGVVRLAGIDQVAGAVVLVSGRTPRGACLAARCEVLYAGGSPPAASVTDRGAHLIVVGRAILSDPRAIGFATRRGDLGGPVTARRPTLLVASDPAGLDRLPGVASVPRSNTWSGSLGFASLHAWDLEGAVRRVAQVGLALQRTTDGFSVTTPQDALDAALARSRQATPRLTAVASIAAAAVAAFLILAAGALRAGILGEDRRLAFRGASTPQRLTMVAAETAVPVAAGVLGGAAIALVAGAARASGSGVPSGRVLSAVLSGLLGRGLIVALAAWLVTALAARLPGTAIRAGLLSATVAVAATLTGMLADASGAARPLPAAVVPLAAGLAALLTALAMPPALRALSRGPLGRRPATGLALVQLARDSGPAAIVVAGLAVGTGLGVFAVGYASTLRHSREARADQLVPATAVVTAGPGLQPPLRRRSVGDWLRATRAEDVAPVLREGASALAGPDRRPVTLLGVPAATLAGVPGLRPGSGAAGRRQLAARLDAGPWAHPFAGLPIPRQAMRLAVRVRRTGDSVRLTALIRDTSGTLHRVGLGTAAPRWRTLSAALPASARGGALVGLALDRQTGQLITATHQTAEGGGGGGSITTGRLTLARVALDGRPEPIATWRGYGGVTGNARRVHYAIGGAAQAMLRAPAVTDRLPLPVLADPATAADAAISHGLDVDVDGATFAARVVGVARQMPTVAGGQPMLIADRSALSAAIDSRQPGAAEPAELWLAAHGADRAAVSAAAREQARRLGLRVRTRQGVLAALQSEPVGNEVLGALAASTLLVMVLAILAAAMMARADLHDRAHALRDLEEQGYGPSALRRGLRSRAVILALLAAVPGLVLGWALDRLLARAVLAGSAGPRPDPPIVASVPVTATVVVVVALASAAVLAGWAATTVTFREREARAEGYEPA